VASSWPPRGLLLQFEYSCTPTLLSAALQLHYRALERYTDITMSNVEKQSQAVAPAPTTQDHMQSTEPLTTPTQSVQSSKNERPAQTILAKEVGDSSTDDLEPVPHVHLKTYLAVFAVCLIYFAQDFALVGAGSVCVSEGSDRVYPENSR